MPIPSYLTRTFSIGLFLLTEEYSKLCLYSNVLTAINTLIAALGSMTSNQPNTLQNVSILIIDADEDAATLFSGMAENDGATVSFASSISEGISKAEELKPDILIANNDFYDGLGKELLRRIRSSRDEKVRNIPAISVRNITQLEDTEVNDELKTPGFQAFLALPIEPEQLVETILKLLGEKRNLTKSS